MQLSHVSGGMIQSGRQFVLKLEHESVGGNAGPFGQQPSTEPAGANVGPFGQHPPSAKQVEQLAIKLNSTRMEEWPLLRLRRQRFNTQIAHIQHLWALGVNELWSRSSCTVCCRFGSGAVAQFSLPCLFG